MFEIACGSSMHVHPDGQSPSAAQLTTFAEHRDVARVIDVQVGGGGVTTLPPSDDETPLPPEQLVTTSGRHVNPFPQSESTWHGRSYLGTQEFVVVVVQGPGSMTGHFVPGAQLGSGAELGQLSLVCAKQTIPVAQSLSLAHGSGAHSVIIGASQTVVLAGQG